MFILWQYPLIRVFIYLPDSSKFNFCVSCVFLSVSLSKSPCILRTTDKLLVLGCAIVFLSVTSSNCLPWYILISGLFPSSHCHTLIASLPENICSIFISDFNHLLLSGSLFVPVCWFIQICNTYYKFELVTFILILSGFCWWRWINGFWHILLQLIYQGFPYVVNFTCLLCTGTTLLIYFSDFLLKFLCD